MQVGQRVGAMQRADQTTVYLYGYGVYEGDHNPFPDDPTLIEYTNPRIKLDNGSVIWGYQCWWGAEEKVRASIGNREVIIVPVETP